MRRCLRKKLQLKEDILIFSSFPIVIVSEKWLLVFLDFDKLLETQNFRFHVWLRLLLVLGDACSFFESVKSSDQIRDETFSKTGWFGSARIFILAAKGWRKIHDFIILHCSYSFTAENEYFFVLSKILSNLWLKLLGNLSDIALLHFCILAATDSSWIHYFHFLHGLWSFFAINGYFIYDGQIS